MASSFDFSAKMAKDKVRVQQESVAKQQSVESVATVCRKSLLQESFLLSKMAKEQARVHCGSSLLS